MRALYIYVKLVNKGCAPEDIEIPGPDCSVWLSTTKQANKYRPLTSADVIAKDTVAVLKEAGIDELYKAHSVRAAGASDRAAKGESDVDIMKRGRWESSSVFVKYYKKSKVTRFSSEEIQREAAAMRTMVRS